MWKRPPDVDIRQAMKDLFFTCNAYVPVQITGQNGVVESNADRPLTVRVEGGELRGFGSANPCTRERYDTGYFTSYQGRALAVVRAGQKGELSVAISGDGLRVAICLPIRENR